MNENITRDSGMHMMHERSKRRLYEKVGDRSTRYKKTWKNKVFLAPNDGDKLGEGAGYPALSIVKLDMHPFVPCMSY